MCEHITEIYIFRLKFVKKLHATRFCDYDSSTSLEKHYGNINQTNFGGKKLKPNNVRSVDIAVVLL